MTVLCYIYVILLTLYYCLYTQYLLYMPYVHNQSQVVLFVFF